MHMGVDDPSRAYLGRPKGSQRRPKREASSGRDTITHGRACPTACPCSSHVLAVGVAARSCGRDPWGRGRRSGGRPGLQGARLEGFPEPRTWRKGKCVRVWDPKGIWAALLLPGAQVDGDSARKSRRRLGGDEAFRMPPMLTFLESSIYECLYLHKFK